MKKQNSLIQRILTHGVNELIDEQEISTLLNSKKTLRIKYGIDPTTTSFHFGHTVPLKKLRELQQLGHKAIFIIGDFTAQIGDPVGKSDTRNMLTLKQTQENAKRYTQFASQFLDMDKTEVYFQSSWYKKITLEETIGLMATVTKEQLMRHETFRMREREGKPLGFHEMFYTLMMAYDSVMVNPDIELGGPDQKFNFLITRQVMKKFNQTPEQIILLDYLPGIDGQEKMSKSAGNFISMEESPVVQFQKLMKIQDRDIITFFKLLTHISDSEIIAIQEKLKTKAVHPKKCKIKLATQILSELHGSAVAQKIKRQWAKQNNRKHPIITHQIAWKSKGATIIELIQASTVQISKRELHRLVNQGAISFNNCVIDDITNKITLITKNTLTIGKKVCIHVVLDL